LPIVDRFFAMPLLLQIIWIAACALALCIYVGWGACHLALPKALRSQVALFIPLIGYAITIWLGYLGVSSVLNLRWSVALLLALATALNLLAWQRGARPHPLAALREHAAPLALFALTALIGVLPLLHYGYATTIGEGWDTESYFPLAQHLNDYTLAQIPDAPISPMRSMTSKPPAIGVTLGYSVFQGMTMLLSGQTVLATFAPLLALLRALGVLACYAWLRATMGLGRAAALLAATLISAGALLLWVSYFNFAMQIAGWPLLALGLVLGVAAVEELAGPAKDERRTTKEQLTDRSSFVVRPSSRIGVALLAGITLAALPVAYYPALTFWGPLAAGLGAALVIERALTFRGAQAVVRLLLAALALVALTLLLAAPTVLDYFKGFSFRYSLPAPHVGPDRFIAISETLGLQAFRLPDDGPQTPAALVWLTYAITGQLVVAGLVLRGDKETRRQGDKEIVSEESVSLSPLLHVSLPDRRLRWLGVLLAAIAYLAWLRFGQAYQYGYMKGSAYAGLVAWGAVALGAQALWRSAGQRARVPLAALVALLLLTTAWAQALTIGDHWSGPANFRRDIATFDQAASSVPADATVVVTSDGAFTGPTSGVFATMLYGREIWGHLSTAYAGLNYWPEGRMPQYALLAANEPAWPLDLGGRELWRSDAAALYQLDPRAKVLLGRTNIYSSASVANKKSPATLEIWRRGGAYRVATADAPLSLLVGETLRFGPGQPDGGTAAQHVSLTVATLTPQRVVIANNASTTPFDLVAGVSQISLPVVAPGTIVITPAQSLALIRMVAVPAEASASADVQLDNRQIAWSATAEQRGDIIQLRVQLANPGRHALRIGLTIVEDAFDRPEQLGQILAAAPLDQPWQISINPVSGATEALVGTQPTPLLKASTAPNPPDTGFFGILDIYDGEQAVAHTPVFSFRIVQGKLAAFAPVPVTVEATPAGPQATPLPSNRRALLGEASRPLDGQAIALEQAVLAHRTPWPGAPADAPLPPGAPLTAQLFWQAGSTPAPPMMVSLQVLGADNHKWAQWDGALGGDWRPVQTWQPGERVRQDVPLQLDPTTPPGNYRLVLVVYDPASGQPHTFGGQSSLDLGELVVQ
jgi:hypothetical protein